MQPIPELFNAVYIFPDQQGMQPLSKFDDMRYHFDACSLPTTPDGSIAEDDYGALMRKGGAPVKVIADFYDRNPDIYDWYYTAYALRDAGPHHGINSLASKLVRPSRGPVYGPVIVVKNAPASLWHLIGKAVSDDGLARTIWWYCRSGVDADEVFKERTLIRVFAARSLGL
ncbi:hypothetical protein FA95DRAFT_1577363 [Auriscalpium vulgare]|uniref:Uncharacterized protein n=1 Tax=Auriscalpium vulgare TaxID=40419 RepID=A0ACB8R7C4_9AGAM|nr:hypothetical protein FA95DRAFT_1577363 [Auriscalpium vulgare]